MEKKRETHGKVTVNFRERVVKDLYNRKTRNDAFTCGMISPKMTRTRVERMKPTSPEVSSEMMMDVKEITATLPKRRVQSKRFPEKKQKRNLKVSSTSPDSLLLLICMLNPSCKKRVLPGYRAILLDG